MSAACPKHMVYGPCGGVGEDGACEVPGVRCPFVSVATAPFSDAAWVSGVSGVRGGAVGSAASDRLRERLGHGGVVIGELATRSADVDALRDCAARMAGLDAVLLGDAPDRRVQLPPSFRAAVVQSAGATPWMGLTCRDRNRVALEGELAGLAALGAAGVHCITGDHPVLGDRPDAAAVFDLDSTRLAALAAGRGPLVSVAESPAAVPRNRRGARLVEKVRAGAELGIVNHCGGPDAVAAFAAEVAALGVTVPLIASVPIAIDAAGVAGLRSFREPGLDPALLDEILAAPDPRARGVAVAIETALRMLDTEVVAGVDLSGLTGSGSEPVLAEAMAEVAEAVRR